MGMGHADAPERAGIDLIFAMEGFSPICAWRLLDDRLLLTRRGRGCEELLLRDITDFYAHRLPSGSPDSGALGCIQFFVGPTLYTLSYAASENKRGAVAAEYLRAHWGPRAPGVKK